MPWQRQRLGVGLRRGPSGQAGREPWEDTVGDTGGHAEPQQRAGGLPVTLSEKTPSVASAQGGGGTGEHSSRGAAGGEPSLQDTGTRPAGGDPSTGATSCPPHLLAS